MSEKMGGETISEKEKQQQVFEATIKLLKGGLGSAHGVRVLYEKLDRVGFNDIDHANFMKIMFDALSMELKHNLEKYDQGDIQPSQLAEGFGHQGIHSVAVFYQHEELVPELEMKLKEYAETCKALMYLHYQLLDNALESCETTSNQILAEEIQKLKEKSTKSSFNQRYQGFQYDPPSFEDLLEIEVRGIKNLLERFPHPFLKEEEKEKILQVTIKKLKAAL